MEKTEKKFFLSKLLGKPSKTKADGKRLYSNTKQTTNKIKLALLDLLKTKQLSQISITNLVKVAGVYRATFYLHYRSLNDVIVDIERDVYDGYNSIKQQMEEVDLFDNMSLLLDKIGEYIKIDKMYMNIIINTNCFNRITLKLKELLYNIIVDNFTKFNHIDNKNEFLLNVSMFTGGVVFAYRDWINELDIGFDEVQKSIKQLAINILKVKN